MSLRYTKTSDGLALDKDGVTIVLGDEEVRGLARGLIGLYGGHILPPRAALGGPVGGCVHVEPILFESEGDARCVAMVSFGHHDSEAFLDACRALEECAPALGVTADMLSSGAVRRTYGRWVGLDEDDPRSPFQECLPGLLTAKPCTLIQFASNGIMPYAPLPGLNEPEADPDTVARLVGEAAAASATDGLPQRLARALLATRNAETFVARDNNSHAALNEARDAGLLD